MTAVIVAVQTHPTTLLVHFVKPNGMTACGHTTEGFRPNEGGVTCTRCARWIERDALTAEAVHQIVRGEGSEEKFGAGRGRNPKGAGARKSRPTISQADAVEMMNEAAAGMRRGPEGFVC